MQSHVVLDEEDAAALVDGNALGEEEVGEAKNGA
jgi:hypothetical protein